MFEYFEYYSEFVRLSFEEERERAMMMMMNEKESKLMEIQMIDEMRIW